MPSSILICFFFFLHDLANVLKIILWFTNFNYFTKRFGFTNWGKLKAAVKSNDFILRNGNNNSRYDLQIEQLLA